MKTWFQKSFPRFNFDDDDNCLVVQNEWDNFAKSLGTTFPPCQYSPGAVAHNQNLGVVLVGDSLHAFPPDIGQGINAALTDVAVLDKCLKKVTL